MKHISTSEVFLLHLSSFPCPKADMQTSFGTMLPGKEKFALLYGRDYFAGLRVTKRNKATVLLTLTLLQTPILTLILTLTLT